MLKHIEEGEIEKFGLPIAFLINSTIFNGKEYFITRTGVSIEVGNEVKIFTGSSCNLTLQESKKIAIWEAIERLYSSHYVYFLEERINIYSLNHKKLRSIPAKTASHSYPYSNLEATGIAIHENTEAALINGVHELLEHHLCSQFWYNPNIKIMPIPHFEMNTTQYKIQHYTLTAYNSVPFVVSTIEDPLEKILVAGTALKSNWVESQQHSFKEALKLFVILKSVSPEKAILENTKLKKKILSLRGELTQKRKQHIQSKLSMESFNKKNNAKFSVKSLLNRILGYSYNIQYAAFNIDTFSLIRVFSEEIDYLSPTRSKIENKAINFDFYC